MARKREGAKRPIPQADVESARTAAERLAETTQGVSNLAGTVAAAQQLAETASLRGIGTTPANVERLVEAAQSVGSIDAATKAAQRLAGSASRPGAQATKDLGEALAASRPPLALGMSRAEALAALSAIKSFGQITAEAMKHRDDAIQRMVERPQKPLLELTTEALPPIDPPEVQAIRSVESQIRDLNLAVVDLLGAVGHQSEIAERQETGILAVVKSLDKTADASNSAAKKLGRFTAILVILTTILVILTVVLTISALPALPDAFALLQRVVESMRQAFGLG